MGGNYDVHIAEPLVAFTEGSITVSNASVALPASILAVANGGHVEVLLGVETDQIRMSIVSGGSPSTGMLYAKNDKIYVAGSADVKNCRMIRVTNDATVRYQAFRRPI